MTVSASSAAPATAPALGTATRPARRIVASAGVWAARVAGVLALTGSVAISLWLVLAAAERPSQLSGVARKAQFQSWIVGPLGHRLPGLTTNPDTLQRDFLVALLGLFACWIVAVLTVRHLHIAWVAAAAGLTGIVFFLGPPLSLTDLFNYLHYGRMGAVHGVNPYVVVPAAVRHDPTWHLANWRHLLSPYGPLFTLVTYALAHLSLHAAYWAWKAIVMCSAFGVLGLVWWTAGRLGRAQQTAVALVALNPLVLVYGLGAQHNDPLMLLALVGAVALAAGGLGASRPGAWSAGAGASVVAAAALKLSAGVLAPLVVLGAARRRSALAGALAGTAVACVVVQTVFAGQLPAVGVQDRLVTPLSVPQFGGWLAGQGGETALIRTLCHVVLAATLAGAVLAVWRRRALLPAACGTVMLVTVLTLGWTMPWYVWWVLPFAALARTRWLAGACVVLTLWLGLGAIPQMPQIIHHYGYFPSRTTVGRAHHRLTEQLLK